MSVVLYMATSADGFIAGPKEETPWSDDEWKAFQEFVKFCDVCLLGRRTFEIMQDGEEFVKGPRYIVVSNDNDFATGEYEKLSIKSAADIPQAEKVGIIGGGELNASIAKLGVVDEVILDIEPITFGGGKQLFGNNPISLQLKLLGTKQIGSSTIQNHYKVIK